MTTFQSDWSQEETVDENRGLAKLIQQKTKLINFQFMGTQITLHLTCNTQD